MKPRIRNLPAVAAIVLWSSGALAQQADSARAGRDIFADRAKGNCLACHAIADSDVRSTVGPELSGMRKRFPRREDIAAILFNEQSRNPQTVMPPFGANRILTPTEIDKVVDFLLTL